MPDEKAGESAAEQTGLEESGSAGPGNEGEPAAENDVEGRLADALSQVESLKDQALRAQAEAENVRRRSSRDVENAHKYALENFTQELLPVLDSLEKAVELATQAEAAEAAASAGAEAIAEGVELSLKMFHSVLDKAGIAQVDPLGEPFDPQHHEAMAMIPSPDAEPNSVIEVMQKGYTLNGRLVRAAMVVVSKAPEETG